MGQSILVYDGDIERVVGQLVMVGWKLDKPDSMVMSDKLCDVINRAKLELPDMAKSQMADD